MLCNLPLTRRCANSADRLRPTAPSASWVLPCVLLLGAMAQGCAGYRVGARSLYPPDIQTIYVPIIDSKSYRRFLGERLTEAVVKRIEEVTPFKVVHTPDADSVL
ncbi:MAG TPA: hypothetical protein VGX78_08200, partial [Pirellulales bacterium]|nr:hypothetical protein [Pirellulales bacterium]